MANYLHSPSNGIRSHPAGFSSPRSCSPRAFGPPRTYRFASPRSLSARGSSPRFDTSSSHATPVDRRRGLVAEAREAPLRNTVTNQPKEVLPATIAAAALEREHRKRDKEREKEREKMASSFAEKKMALRMKREGAAKAAETEKRRANDEAMTRARNAAVAERQRNLKQRAVEEADSRARMQRVLDVEEAERNRANAEDYIKRMRDQWQASRRPTDPFAQWRGESGADASDASEEEAIVNICDADDDEQGEEGHFEEPTEEEMQIAKMRLERVAERDGAAQRILAMSSKTLHDALGLPASASDAEVDSSVRKLLRLLHPDYSINLKIKGTRKQQRIEAAYKRLNGLRAAPG